MRSWLSKLFKTGCLCSLFAMDNCKLSEAGSATDMASSPHCHQPTHIIDPDFEVAIGCECHVSLRGIPSNIQQKLVKMKECKFMNVQKETVRVKMCFAFNDKSTRIFAASNCAQQRARGPGSGHVSGSRVPVSVTNIRIYSVPAEQFH